MGPPPVSVSQPVVQEIVEYDEYTGRFRAVESVEVRARVSGYLDEIEFTPGEIVEAGQTLFVIDQRPFQAAFEAAQADLQSAQAQLRLAEAELERARPLVSRGNLSESAFDERVQQRNVTAANVQRARANLRQAELNLEFTEVKAPVSGRAGRDLVTEGNLVTGGDVSSTLLTTIVSLNPIHFYFTVSEADFLKYIRLIQEGDRPSSRDGGNPAWVKLGDEDAFERVGVIDFVDNQLSRTTGTIEGRAIFPNEDLFLAPGLFGRIRIIASTPYEAILIPDEAIGRDQSQKFVFVVGAENKAERRVIETGPLHQGLRVVRSGLTAEDRIVVSGIQRVRPGSPVTPQDDPIEAPEPQDIPNVFAPADDAGPIEPEEQPQADEAGTDETDTDESEGEAPEPADPPQSQDEQAQDGQE